MGSQLRQLETIILSPSLIIESRVSFRHVEHGREVAQVSHEDQTFTIALDPQLGIWGVTGQESANLMTAQAVERVSAEVMPCAGRAKFSLNPIVLRRDPERGILLR